MTGTATVLRADARHLPLPDASVDLIVTSPPYFALRSYTDGGEHYDGQIGAEPTPAEYIASLIDCTAEWMRVLKLGGSIWVNLGDKYSGYNNGSGKGRSLSGERAMAMVPDGKDPHAYGVANKSLMMLPERYRIAAVDELGLIARAVVIWSKPNGLPESVTDRVRRSHEDWVHLTRLPRYFSAVDEIREQHAGEFLSSGVRNPRYGCPGGLLPWELRGDDRPAVRAGVADPNQIQGMRALSPANPLGKLPGSVWTIPTEPLTVPDHLGVDHFAAFPTEWPRRIILGWSPSGICVECGEGRRPVAERLAGGRPRATTTARDPQWQAINRADWQEGVQRTITGEACACPEPTAPTRPSVILDPFGGTGTTALVAKALGRHGISVDRSADYCRLARWRTTDPGQLAKAMRVTKPPGQLDGQGDLFEVAS